MAYRGTRRRCRAWNARRLVPARSATTQCSMRAASPETCSGYRAISPAAKMPGELVCSVSSTTTPLSVLMPAASANVVRGETPTPSMTRSASTECPSARSTRSRRIAREAVFMRKRTPCCSCRRRIKLPRPLGLQNLVPSGIASCAMIDTSSPRWRSEAATSRPIKPQPITAHFLAPDLRGR